eukprot:m.879992 g.879992  ORF g.879992 m.879992 type:complete len:266 (+) comp23589_c0_seq10:261-1058(+)
MPRKKANAVAATASKRSRSDRSSPTISRAAPKKRVTRSSRAALPKETEDHGTQTDDEDSDVTTTTRGTSPPTPALPRHGSPLRPSGTANGSATQTPTTPARVFHPLKTVSPSPSGSPLKRRAMRRLTRGAVGTTSPLRRAAARTASSTRARAGIQKSESPASALPSRGGRRTRTAAGKTATTKKRQSKTTARTAEIVNTTADESPEARLTMDVVETACGESTAASGADVAESAHLYAGCDDIDAIFDVFAERVNTIMNRASHVTA